MGPGYFPRILGILLHAPRRRSSCCAALRGSRRRVPPWMAARRRRARQRRAVRPHRARSSASRSPPSPDLAASAASHEFRSEEAVIAGVLLSALARRRLRRRAAPAAADLARDSHRARAHGTLEPPCSRVRRRAHAGQPAVCAHRLADRHADRRAARHRSRRDDRDAAADHLRAAAGVGADHARRHLLRRAVRRLDDVDPAQHAGRGIVGRDLPRRPPDGAQGTGGRGARHRGAGIVLRRHGRDDADRRAWRFRCPSSR